MLEFSTILLLYTIIFDGNLRDKCVRGCIHDSIYVCVRIIFWDNCF